MSLEKPKDWLILLSMIILTIGTVTFMTGCTGIVTGHKYVPSDGVVIYKVAKAGVTTFMTEEQIKNANLDKVDNVLIDSYDIYMGK